MKESIEKPILFTSRKPEYLFEEVEEEFGKPMFIASDDDDEQSYAETIDIDGLPPPSPPPHHIVEFLPETITGLRESFERVMREIALKRKASIAERTCDRNEAVFLLDELKRQDGISHRMYKQRFFSGNCSKYRFRN